jgi:hypothetical protein
VYSSAVPDKKETAQETRDAVNKMLQHLEKKMSQGEVKATLGDYIRLLQLQREMDEEQPSEITVTWVDAPCEK